MPLEKLISTAYRLARYHSIETKGGPYYIGFKGLSCEGCDAELQKERGCQKNGNRFISRNNTYRIDYHDPLTPEDKAIFCPQSLRFTHPEILQIVNDALEIKSNGGLSAYSGSRVGGLPSWWITAYTLVLDAEKRTTQEVEAMIQQLRARG